MHIYGHYKLKKVNWVKFYKNPLLDQMRNFGPIVAQNFGNLFRMHVFFKKHKFKKHEAQKAKILKKNLRNTARLTLTNITGKITFI